MRLKSRRKCGSMAGAPENENEYLLYSYGGGLWKKKMLCCGDLALKVEMLARP